MHPTSLAEVEASSPAGERRQLARLALAVAFAAAAAAVATGTQRVSSTHGLARLLAPWVGLALVPIVAFGAAVWRARPELLASRARKLLASVIVTAPVLIGSAVAYLDWHPGRVVHAYLAATIIVVAAGGSAAVIAMVPLPRVAPMAIVRRP